MIKIGPHILKTYKNKNLHFNINEEILRARNENFNINTVAFFISGPKNYKINLKDDNEIKNIKNLNLNIYIHNNYVANPWSNILSVRTKSIKSIHDQLDIAHKINAKGFIIHFPKNNVELVMSIIPELINHTYQGIIYFEIPSVSKKISIFHNIDILNNLFNRIKNEINNSKQFGLCIDTAHIWSCGVDISTYYNTKKWLNSLHIINNNILFHLNDNIKNLGISPDIHASLTEGQIWKNYKNNLKESGIFAILEFCKKNNLSIILERKTIKMLNIDYCIINNLFLL